jgi:hypothetical protein
MSSWLEDEILSRKDEFLGKHIVCVYESAAPIKYEKDYVGVERPIIFEENMDGIEYETFDTYAEAMEYLNGYDMTTETYMEIKYLYMDLPHFGREPKDGGATNLCFSYIEQDDEYDEGHCLYKDIFDYLRKIRIKSLRKTNDEVPFFMKK